MNRSFRIRIERIRHAGGAWLAFPIGALVTSQLLTGCNSGDAPRAEVVRPVKTTLVVAGDGAHTRVFPGRVGALRRAELSFSVPGFLASFPVKEGQTVAKGDVIAQLRTNEFKARLTTLQGQLDQSRAALRSLEGGERPEEQLRRAASLRAAEARLANARTDFERVSRAVQTGGVSRSQVDAAETSYQVAQEEYRSARQMVEMGTIGRVEDIEARKAEVRALEGRVTEASIQLDDCTLRAPFHGVVAQRLVEERQNVRAQEAVVRFQDAEELEIAVDVPESIMAADLRTADILQLFAEVGGAPGLQFPVHIREIAQEADPTTQTFRVRAAIEAPQGIQILPGMTATVSMTYRRASILGDRILVPVSAVMEESDDGPSVWIIGADETVTRRPVQVGAVAGGELEIVQGLQPGDRIAVAGVNSLRDGMRVRDLGSDFGGTRP